MGKYFKSKKSAVTILSLFAINFLFAENNFAQYTTKGQDFINKKTGEKVILRGFGLGCWLLPEGYMWGIRKLDRPRMFEKAIVDLIGQDNAKEFWYSYHKNFLSEEDIAAMKSWGANSLRIALLASVLQPGEGQPDYPPYNYSEYGFRLLDTLVKWCEKNEIGIIWDMHGAPGAQNAENISDSDGEARLWTEKEKYWPMCIELWYKIAERYKNSGCIIGYDLLNEPLLIRYKNIDPKLLRKLYVQLTDTIRKVDKDGIIFIEGDDWAQTFDILEPMDWDPRLALAFHSYPPTSNRQGLERWDKFRKKYNIPLWHGETGEQDPPYKLNVEATKFLESENVSWSWWTHKKFDLQTQPWSCVRDSGFLKILDYWNGIGEKPSKEEAKKWLFEQAKMTNSNYCDFFPEMVSSLIPLNPDKYVENKTIEKPEIVIQPDDISVEEGGAGQSGVRARGFPLNYQWFKNGEVLAGQKSFSLNISNPSLEDNNNTYFVRISNAEGSIESKHIILNVNPFTGPLINKTAVSPKIDAVPDDIWGKVQSIPLANISHEKNSKSDISAWIKLTWDSSNLYLWVQTAENVKSDGQGSLEIYLDPDNSKQKSYGDYHYHLRYIRNDSYVKTIQGELEGKISAAQKNVDGGYQMELAIPWNAVHGSPGAGKYIGIDVHVVSNYQHRRATLTWSRTRGFAQRSPMSLGTMKLVEK